MSDYPDTPITREEQYLAAGLDGGDLPDPITREEQYLYEIATKMQGGGSTVTVEPLTVTQNGTTTAPSGKAYSPVTVYVPNPNYVEEISGTIGSPFGDYTIAEIVELVRSDNATIRMHVQGYGNFVGQSAGDYLNFVQSIPARNYPQASWTMYSISYALPDGSLFGWVVAENDRGDSTYGPFLRAYSNNAASEMSCTLTIIHHPLPDSE